MSGIIWVRSEITFLLEEIELWLKRRLELELRAKAGGNWWDGIPAPVRKRARFRHELASEEYGRRRAGDPHSVSWLSFGDAIATLDSLSDASWLRCVEATRKRRNEFSSCLRRIKSFRDSRLAHQQPGGPTPSEVERTLTRIDHSCYLLRPEEYSKSLEGRARLKTISGRDRRLLFDLYEPRGRRPVAQRKRLEKLKRLFTEKEGLLPKLEEVRFFDALILSCLAASSTISWYVADA
jgi:hypothetical protein